MHSDPARTDTGHTVTGTPDRAPAHAARPSARPGWPWLLAALAVCVGAAAAVLLATGEPTTSTPPSARTITATSAPPP